MAQSGGDDADGEDAAAADLELDARKRARRRSGENGAVRHREQAAVAAALEGVFVGAVKDWAGIVSADATVGDIGRLACANEDAGRDISGVLEDFRAADGDFADACNHYGGRGA